MSCWMCCRVNDVSKELRASIFRVKQSKSEEERKIKKIKKLDVFFTCMTLKMNKLLSFETSVTVCQ